MSTLFVDQEGNQFWQKEDGSYHREDGPAVEFAGGSDYWIINDVDITERAIAWIMENNFPHWTKWTDNQKIVFKLAFSGTAS